MVGSAVYLNDSAADKPTPVLKQRRQSHSRVCVLQRDWRIKPHKDVRLIRRYPWRLPHLSPLQCSTQTLDLVPKVSRPRAVY